MDDPNDGNGTGPAGLTGPSGQQADDGPGISDAVAGGPPAGEMTTAGLVGGDAVAGGPSAGEWAPGYFGYGQPPAFDQANPASSGSGQAPPVPPAVAPATKPRRAGRLVLLIVLIIAGLGGIVGGGTMLALELTRGATSAEAAVAGSQELVSRWERLTAGTIFPAKVTYLDPDGVKTTASLVGIAPPASCGAAIDPQEASALRHFGCQVVLRATYVDASRTLLITAGIAVMASPSAASEADVNLSGNHYGPGLRVVTFSGTVAEKFGNAQRAFMGYAQTTGPYLFLYAAGYADGRLVSAASGNPEIPTFGAGVLANLETALTQSGSPCKMRDIRC